MIKALIQVGGIASGTSSFLCKLPHNDSHCTAVQHCRECWGPHHVTSNFFLREPPLFFYSIYIWACLESGSDRQHFFLLKIAMPGTVTLKIDATMLHCTFCSKPLKPPVFKVSRSLSLSRCVDFSSAVRLCNDLFDKV